MGDAARTRKTSDEARSVFWKLLAFRLVNSLVMNTFFQPDEYFQSLEPAWQMAFGTDSGAWITWVSKPPPLTSRTELMLETGMAKAAALVAASCIVCRRVPRRRQGRGLGPVPPPRPARDPGPRAQGCPGCLLGRRGLVHLAARRAALWRRGRCVLVCCELSLERTVGCC